MENRIDMEKKSEMEKRQYGFFTATTMIVGTVIGSGIFFKSDDILTDTGGSVVLGVLVFLIAAWGIIFGSLTIIELANRTNKNGGMVGYYEEFVSSKLACGFGWFQAFVYFPTLIVVIAWVAGVYTCSFLGLEGKLETQCVLGLLYLLFFYVMNLISTKLGGYFQNVTTVIKLIPLLFIAVVGCFWGTKHQIIVDPKTVIVSTKSVGFGWIAALAPTAFSFDGWVVATNITNEVKNPKKNMTLALIVGPLIVLMVYLSFFLGLNNILGVDYILSTRDAAINQVGKLLLGNDGTKILLLFILISVWGVLNGLILGGIRLPQALASKHMLPYAAELCKASPRKQFSGKAWTLSLLISIFWFVIHYISQKTNILNGGDIGEIAIVFSYISYIILYIKVILLKKKGLIQGVWKGFICPLFAIFGAIIIFVGGFLTDPFYVFIFVCFCIAIFLGGILYYDRKAKKVKER